MTAHAHGSAMAMQWNSSQIMHVIVYAMYMCLVLLSFGRAAEMSFSVHLRVMVGGTKEK